MVTTQVIEPLISLTLAERGRRYRPGDTLHGELQIDCCDPDDISAVETSVMWYTEGKGDEDIGVHLFERRTPSDAEDNNLCLLHYFESTLPKSPLSYDGVIVKIRWCVRVRLFLHSNKEVFFELPLQLGDVPPRQLDEGDESDADDRTDP